MRILVLSNLYPPHAVGGYELMCRDVVGRLRERGHRVVVLTSGFRRPDVSEADEPDVRRKLEIYWDGRVLLKPAALGRLAIERGNRRGLRRALAELEPDVVFVWAMGLLSLGLLETLVERRRPLVYFIGDDWLSYGPWADPWMRGFEGRPLIARATRVITGLATEPPSELGRSGAFLFASDFLRRRALERTPWDFPSSTVTYGGIDTRDFPLASEGAGRPWGWRLLYVGRLREDKGPATAIEALARLPEAATLELVGHGSPDARATLEELASGLGLQQRMRFSICQRSELRARYLAADVLLFPSTGEEGFGLVPLEGMACGTPVVASVVGGSREFLLDGINCLGFPGGDASLLATAVERLAGSPSLRAALVAAGRETAAQLTVDTLTDVLEAWLAAAARGFVGGSPPDRDAIRVPGVGSRSLRLSGGVE